MTDEPTDGVAGTDAELRTAELETYLGLVFGDHQGFVAVVVGHGGHYPEGKSKYEMEWKQHYFRWPSERPACVSSVINAMAAADTYVIPFIRNRRSTKAESSAEGCYVWADVDGNAKEVSKVLESFLCSGSFVVHSGSEGSLHAYIRLDGWYEPEIVEALNKRLAKVLSADSKWSSNAFLRPPGTLNHKARARGSTSTHVRLELSASDRPPWSPSALSEALGPLRQVDRKQPRTKKVVPDRMVAPPAGPLPEGLPVNVKAQLSWSGPRTMPGQDVSRSGRVHSTVKACIAHGYDDDQILAIVLHSEPGRDKWPDPSVLAREILRCLGGLRPSHDHAGRTCMQAGCSEEKRVAGQIGIIRNHFNEHHRPGRSAAADSKVFHAICNSAEGLHKVRLDLSIRKLSVMAGVSKDTASASIKRLMSAHYLEKETNVKGNPILAGQGAVGNRAHGYRLVIPSVEPMTHTHRRGEGGGTNTKTNKEIAPDHDIWSYKGLGNQYLTFVALVNGDQLVEQIWKSTGSTARTVRNHLGRLASFGLAEESDGRWIPLMPDLDAVARLLGVEGLGQKRADAYMAEREKFNRHLESRNQLPAISKGSQWQEVPGKPGVYRPIRTSNEQ